MSTSELENESADVPAKQRLNLQIKVDTTSTCKRHVTVTIPRDDIERYFLEAYDELVPKAEVAGFRPGRAPRKLVEHRYREQMSNQVKGSLLMDSVTQVSDESAFSAISEPDLDFEAVTLPPEGPMTFEFDIEVRPEFELPEWRGLQLIRPVHEYSEDEVTRHLNKLLARFGRTVDKNGPVEAQDQVELRIQFADGDQPLSEVVQHSVAVRSTVTFRDGNLDGFDQLILGKRPGDRVAAKVTISKDSERVELRGKEVTANITVIAVKSIETPELTPPFLEKIGGFADEQELREAVREELERQLNYFQQRKIREQITSQLIRGAVWELPDDLLRRQYSRELQRAVLELRSNGFSDDDIRLHENQIRQNSMISTANALKEHFILERIAEDQKFEATDADYENEIRSIANQRQESARRVRARLEKKGQMDALRNQIIERKVVDLITEAAQFTDEPFQPSVDDRVAIDHSISGHQDETEIPEAKYGGEPTELPGQKDN